MTGYFVRMWRGGQWESIEIDQLSDAELAELECRHPEAGWKWAKALAKWIRGNVRLMDINDVVGPPSND